MLGWGLRPRVGGEGELGWGGGWLVEGRRRSLAPSVCPKKQGKRREGGEESSVEAKKQREGGADQQCSVFNLKTEHYGSCVFFFFLVFFFFKSLCF